MEKITSAIKLSPDLKDSVIQLRLWIGTDLSGGNLGWNISSISVAVMLPKLAPTMPMREVLPIMWLLEEAQKKGIKVSAKPCKVHCKVFEDNEGAIEIAKVPKMRPRQSTSTSSIIISERRSRKEQ
jgi:hypothetical protein